MTGCPAGPENTILGGNQHPALTMPGGRGLKGHFLKDRDTARGWDPQRQAESVLDSSALSVLDVKGQARATRPATLTGDMSHSLCGCGGVGKTPADTQSEEMQMAGIHMEKCATQLPSNQ